MKCPFKKETHTCSSNPMYHGYPADKETFEVFTDCIGEECAIWSGIDCSFKQKRIDPSPENILEALQILNPYNS
ncbi:MAG: hypothetical protein E7167_02215 [Firmicutes bacterium]|nr:hypothetical protein [Bacillota bacterium]